MFNLFSKKELKQEEVTVKEEPKKEINKPTTEEFNKYIDTKEKIDDLISDFFNYDKFIKDSKQYADEELRDSVKENIDHNFVYTHIYGEIPSYDKNISKVDFTKDCRIFEVTVTDVVDLRTSLRYLRRYIRRFESFMTDLIEYYSEFKKICNKIQNNENENILDRIELMLDSYITDTSYCFNTISDLLCILNRYYDKNLDNIGNKLKFVKYDTLKRYYFTNTYSLKSSVKLFNKEAMVFGEINNIMKQYNFVYNFVFGTLVCDIQTIKTVFDSIK